MKSLCLSVCSATLLLAFAGCRSKEEIATPAEAPPAPETEQAAQEAAQAAPPQTPAEAISSARQHLKSGSVDEAAAKLAQLQMQGVSFNAQQASDYRQALSDAYDRAIEAAQRGDPKGEAALKLLRAAGPR